MTVIASYVYRNGKREEAVPVLGPAPKLEGKDFVWIGLHEPTEEELGALATTYDLHQLSVEDALSTHQVPKIEVYGDQLFIIAKTAHLEGDIIVYGETAIFVSDRHIITVRHGSSRRHTEVRSLLEASPTQLAHGPDYVLHGILDFIADGYLPVIQTIEDTVLEMEQAMLGSFLKRAEIVRLFQLRRQLILFDRVLGPMLEVAGRLVNLDFPCLNDHAKPFFRDVYDHIHRVENMVSGLREVIAFVFEASNLLEQQGQSVISRQLAAGAAIMAVPTAIAGIYGMNFENMPELKWQYGYFVVLGVMVSVCLAVFTRFRKSGWL